MIITVNMMIKMYLKKNTRVSQLTSSPLHFDDERNTS